MNKCDILHNSSMSGAKNYRGYFKIDYVTTVQLAVYTLSHCAVNYKVLYNKAERGAFCLHVERKFCRLMCALKCCFRGPCGLWPHCSQKVES